MSLLDRLKTLDPKDPYDAASMVLAIALGYYLHDTYRTAQHRLFMESFTRATNESTASVHSATVLVHEEIQRLAQETARAQRLAVWVGVCTAILGAIVGGFAGAVAAKLLGG